MSGESGAFAVLANQLMAPRVVTRMLQRGAARVYCVTLRLQSCALRYMYVYYIRKVVRYYVHSTFCPPLGTTGTATQLLQTSALPVAHSPFCPFLLKHRVTWAILTETRKQDIGDFWRKQRLPCRLTAERIPGNSSWSEMK